MEIKTYSPSEQVDIAVDLGVVPPPYPGIVTRRELKKAGLMPPPQVIDGVLHQGCKMVLSGTSKSNKTWCLLNLAASVSSGTEWLGRRCAKMPVLYLNFELHEWAMSQRLDAICSVRSDCGGVDDGLHLWNLRGHNSDIALMRPKLEEELARYEFGLIILDPVYKVLGDRDENANGEIAGLMNELEQLARRTRAAIVIAHHFAKGDSTVKNAIDRMSGAGAWARDPDSLVVMTPHEEDDCFTVSMTLRNLPRVEDFVVEWIYPIVRVAGDLNPDALRRPQGKNKVCTDREFVERVFGEKGLATKAVRQQAHEEFGMSARTADRYLARNLAAGVLCHSGGLYWPAHQGDTTQ
jgi:hypothetical protein